MEESLTLTSQLPYIFPWLEPVILGFFLVITDSLWELVMIELTLLCNSIWVCFSFYSLIEIGKGLSKETFKTIKSAVGDIDSVVNFVSEVKASFPTLIRRYVPDIQTIPLSQGMRWVPSEKALPSTVAFLLIWTILPASALYLNLTTLVLPEWSSLM